MTLKATGKKNGRKITVEYDGEDFLFNGKFNPEYNREIRRKMAQCHFRGGTFQPEEKSDLNIVNVIETRFFDRGVIAEVKDADVEEMENVDGRIY